MAGGVVGTGQQQPIRVRSPTRHAVLKQALGDLLVVGVVAGAAGGQGQPLHEPRPVGAGVEIGPSPGRAALLIEADCGRLQTVEYRLGREAVRPGRRLDLAGLHVPGVSLMVGGAFEK